jgi:hypothetical protein
LAAENVGVGLELFGKVFSLKRKAFNRKERKECRKEREGKLGESALLSLQHDQNGLAFPES